MTVFRQLWQVLSHEQRRGAVILITLLVFSAVLETAGIGLIIPAIAVMVQTDIGQRYPVLAPLLDRLGNPNQEELVTGAVVLLLAVYVAKALFLSYLAWRQARYVYQLQANLSQRLFEGYLRQPYAFHLRRNSALLIRNTGQASDLMFMVKEGLALLAELMMLGAVAVLMLSVEPIGTLAVGATLGAAGLAFARFSRAHVLRWGQAQQFHEGLRIQHLQQGLAGAKDVKVLGREDDFLMLYRLHSSAAATVTQRCATVAALPRLVLEVLAMAGLTALVLVFFGQGKPLSALIPTLGLFAAVAFRVMPSVNRVLGATQNVRFYMPVINTLHAELLMLDATAAPPARGADLPLGTSLTLEDVHFRYEGAETSAVRGITLTIPRGATAGFIGGSGAGKSTLIDLILGLLTPTGGAIKVDGIDIQSRLRNWQDQIGYVQQSIFLTDDTLRRNIAFGIAADQVDDAAVRRAVRQAQLEEFIAELPQGLETMVGERGIRLSGGQRQRIGIARALYHDPPVLVLDEATSSLDTVTERGIMDAVRAFQGHKTVIIVAHRLSTVEHCDLLFRLDRGRVVQQGAGATVLGRSAS